MRISIIGLGWFGEPLAKALLKDGHEISGSTRTQEKKDQLTKENIKVDLLDYPGYANKDLLDADIVVLNIPPFSNQLEWFESWQWNPNTWIIFISSTSVYSKKNSENISTLKQEESWIQSEFNNWTILRFGGLIGNGRHPGKHLSGKKNLPGRLWPVNLVHIDDCIGVTKTIIQKKIQNEIFNVVASDHPTREKFYTDYCLKNGLPLPEFDPHDNSVKDVVSNEKILKSYSVFRNF